MSASSGLGTFALTMSDLPILHEALQPVATEWYNVGLHMEIAVHELDVIEADHFHEGVKICLRKVLMLWLKGLGRQAPSWPSLVAVLRKEGVGEYYLAAKLQQEHCPQPQVPQGSVSDSSSAAKPLSTGQPKSSKKDIKSEDIVPAFKKGDSKTDTLLLLLNRVDRPVREITDSDGKTLLHLACRHSYIQWRKVVMSLVHDHHCDLSATDRDGNIPLHNACGYNNEELVKYLLTLPGWSPNVKNSEGETALHVAIYKGSRNIVRILLASGRVNHTLHSCKKDDAEFFGPDINPEIKTLLNNFKECVDKYNSPTPYPLLTCCVLISLLNEFLLKSSDDRCTLNEIVAVSRQHEAPLPFNNATQMKNLLLLIKQHFQIIENDRDLDTIVCKHPRPPPVYAVQDVQPGQLEEEILEIGQETCGHSEQEPVKAVTMAKRTPEKGGDPIEPVSESESKQLLVSEDTTHQWISHQQPRSIRRNRHRDLRDCCSSCGESTAVCCASCLEVGRMCCSRCRENGWDCRSSEDSSRIKFVSCKDCWRKHPIRCAIGLLITVIISVLLGFSFILVSSLTSTDPMSETISTRPNDTVMVRNEGFDPSKFATVEIEKAVPTDPHVVNFYLECCNELTALQLAIETVRHLEIVEQHTVISSYYLLVDSELTFVVTLNETVDQRHSEIIIFDSVADHFGFIQSNITNSPLHIFPFSNGSTNFTLTASISSYYFIVLSTPLSAGPTSIQYQVNGAIFYYDPTDFQRVCAIIPGVNTSCSISLRPDTGSQYCILTQVEPLNTDNENTFVNNTYTSVPPTYNDIQLSILIIGLLLCSLSCCICSGCMLFVKILQCTPNPPNVIKPTATSCDRL